MAAQVTLDNIFALSQADIARVLSTQGLSLTPRDEKNPSEAKNLNRDRAIAAMIYYNSKMITLPQDKDIIKNPSFLMAMSSVSSLQEGLSLLGVKRQDESFIMSSLIPELQGVVSEYFTPLEAFVYNIAKPDAKLARLSKDFTTESAIVSTVETGWLEGMEFLLKTAPEEAKRKLASRAFVAAAGVENHDIMKRLYDEYKFDKYTLISALNKAASTGKILSVSWLMSKTPLDGIELGTLLRLAARNGHLHLVQFLGTRGATHWEIAFHSAIMGGQVTVLEWLVTSGRIDTYDKNSVLSTAIRAEQIPVLDWVVSKGVYRDTFDGVLYEASLKGYIPIMEWAVNKGARNVNELLANAHEFAPDVVEWLQSKV